MKARIIIMTLLLLTVSSFAWAGDMFVFNLTAVNLSHSDILGVTIRFREKSQSFGILGDRGSKTVLFFKTKFSYPDYIEYYITNQDDKPVVIKADKIEILDKIILGKKDQEMRVEIDPKHNHAVVRVVPGIENPQKK